jgi:CheY-like chemotaxis protein
MILLVEDEAIARYAFAQILRFNGHEVVEAKDGTEALTLLDKYALDLVITDLIMPSLDGFALVTRIRQQWPAMPIIIISGYTAQFAAAALTGATEFLPKPIDPPVLIATVQRLLAKSPKLYRRKQQSEVWHFCDTCSQWPGEDYVEQRHMPSTSEVCNECIVEWHSANSH